MPAVLKIRKLRLRGARRTGAEPEAPLASQHGRGGMLLVALAGVSPLGSLVKTLLKERISCGHCSCPGLQVLSVVLKN